MDRLSVLCFAGTYGLALISDVARLAFRGAGRWSLTFALTALGWAVHTAYLGNLTWRDPSLPISTDFGSLLTLAWILAAIDLYLVARARKPVAIGLFILPVVVCLATAAGLLLRRGPRDAWVGGGHAWITFWGMTHGLLLLGGAVSTCVAFAAGLMYLAQARRLKSRGGPRLAISLPSLEQSERLNRAAITLAFPLLTFGMLTGAALVPLARSAGGISVGWTDPKVLGMFGLWLTFAVLLNARYRPAMRGRRVMILTAIAFGFLVFTWVGVGLILKTEHGLARADLDGSPSASGGAAR